MDTSDARLPAHPAEIGDFRLSNMLVRPSLNRIEIDGEVRQVRPRVMHILACLASRRGGVISREDLLATIWGDAVVGEEGLTVAISELRRILDDSPRAPRYIETIRKGGYRLATPVVLMDGEKPEPSDAPPRPIPFPRWLLFGAIAVLIAAGLFGLFTRETDDAPPYRALEGTPLTSLPGSEFLPDFSPDGTRVAFCWREPESGNTDIYVISEPGSSPLRVTTFSGADLQPAWSPDGERIGFVRLFGGNGIFAIPATGGRETLLFRSDRRILNFDWSPRGDRLAIATSTEDEMLPSIFLFSIEDSTLTRLTEPEAPFIGDMMSVFSPDGERIAFSRAERDGQRDIWVVPTAGGEARRLTRDQSRISGFCWTRDGAGILFVGVSGMDYMFKRLDVASGEIETLPRPWRTVANPSIAGTGDLVFEAYNTNQDIWEIDLTDPARPVALPEPLITSTRTDMQPRFSHDGARIAFMSTRSGEMQIWICREDGSEPRALTAFGGGEYVADARWSPDDRRIAFSTREEGTALVYVIEVATGVLRCLSDGGRDESLLDWSERAGLVIETKDADGFAIEFMDPETGACARVLEDARNWLGETADGAAYLYGRQSEPGIWRHAIADGDVTLAVPAERMAGWLQVVADSHLGYNLFFADGRRCLGAFDPVTQESDSLVALTGFGMGEFTLSPDGRRILYHASERMESDLILVRDFR